MFIFFIFLALYAIYNFFFLLQFIWTRTVEFVLIDQVNSYKQYG